MVADVLTVDPAATLMQAAQTMRNANVGVLPVVGKDRTLMGLITDRDLVVRAMSEGADPATSRVREFATQDLICARADSPIDEALEVMRECQIGRLPVVDYNNKVVGMVTLSSLALRARDHDAALHTAEDVSRRSARVA
jgi:CBS domain-containing protein